MVIAETRKKLTLTPFDIIRGKDKDDSAAPTITLTEGKLLFNKKLIEELNLDKKFIRFFYDPVKLVVAFQIRSELPLESLKGEGKWRPVNISRFGNWTVTLRKILEKTFGVEYTKKKVRIPLQKYREMSDVMSRGEVYYFIELNHESDVQDSG